MPFRPVLLAVLLTLCAAAPAQRHGDPLTDAEINKLRDSAQEPAKRLIFYVEFARTRLDAAQTSLHDSKVANHAEATREHLQDFIDIYDELSDNVDTFADRRYDIRKP